MLALAARKLIVDMIFCLAMRAQCLRLLVVLPNTTEFPFKSSYSSANVDLVPDIIKRVEL